MELAFIIEQTADDPILTTVPDGAHVPTVGEKIFLQGFVVGSFIVVERKYNLKVEKPGNPAVFGWSFVLKKEMD